jgi:transcriptional antiterminator
MLTAREIQIATKLLENDKTLRTQDLSKQLDVSTRTIKYDLENVRRWFQKYEVEFCAQPNKGYWINSSKNERLKLYQALMDMDSKPLYSDQNTRVEKIIYMFFSKNGYITASQISTHLQVSRNTVMSDLNYLEFYIKPWKINLERKPRIGYKLIGEEFHIRLLFEHIIQGSLSNFNVNKINSQIKSNKVIEVNNGFIPEIQTKFEIILKYFRIISKVENQNILSHLEALSIFLRLIVFLVRMECEFTIGSCRLLGPNQDKSSPSSKFVLKVMEAICEEFAFPLLEDEFLYVHRNFLLEERNMNLLTVTEEIIHYVSENERVPYYKDTRLFNNLLTHLSLRFEKNTTYVTEVNPFIDEIKQNQSSLFSAIKEACEKMFRNSPNVIQDSFISFIALHFLVSYENVFDKKPKVRALYVCTTGRGVARLIKNRVEREIGDISMTTYCSVMEVEEISKNDEFDLIVSVLPIKSNIPVIIVDPVPTKENIQAIKEKVNNLLQGRVAVDLFTIEENDQPILMDNETISQEIIIKGFEVSYEILNTLADKIMKDHQKGLQVHLFLMIHRYYFHKQYDQFIHQQKDHQDEDLLKQINAILHSHSITINETEQRALLEYFS